MGPFVVALAGLIMLGGTMGGPKKQECARLDLRDAVDIMTTFDVTHQAIAPIPTGMGTTIELHGNTNIGKEDFKSWKKIWINAYYNEPIQRLTVLHEMYHIRQQTEKLKNDETTVRRCAIRKYKDIYGSDFDLPPYMQEFPPEGTVLPEVIK